MPIIHSEYRLEGVQGDMDDPGNIDGVARALVLLDEALALLDAAGLTLAAVQLDHVRHIVADTVATG